MKQQHSLMNSITDSFPHFKMDKHHIHSNLAEKNFQGPKLEVMQTILEKEKNMNLSSSERGHPRWKNWVVSR